jgi:Xaa-Pro dipeptidase
MQLGKAMNEFGMPEPGATALKDNIPQIDMARLRRYRLGRAQPELKRQDFAGCILFDLINVRYATGSRNMAVWMLHNPGRYASVPAE